MAAATEISIVKSIINWINSHPGCYAEKFHGGMYSGNGKPDIDACIYGRCAKIEGKRPGFEPTKIQEATLAKWKRAGAITGCAHSLAEAQQILMPYMEGYAKH